MKAKKRLIILSGGYSEEAEVSRITASEIARVLNTQKYDIIKLDPTDFTSYFHLIQKILDLKPYIVINGLHGAEGEDGRLQALLELHKIPYTGSNSRSSAFAMDKYLSGIIAAYFDIPTPKRVVITKQKVKETPLNFEFPLVVKPNDSGSSVGISIVQNIDELNNAIKLAGKWSSRIIVEDYIEGRELTVTILGKEALPVVEIKPKNGWYDYTNKYTKGNTIYEVPAKISREQAVKLQSRASLIFRELGCSVYGRVDFRYDGAEFYFLEVNTLPGMTPLSLTPMAAKQEGYNFEMLIEKIIELSIENFKKE